MRRILSQLTVTDYHRMGKGLLLTAHLLRDILSRSQIGLLVAGSLQCEKAPVSLFQKFQRQKYISGHASCLLGAHPIPRQLTNTHFA